MDVARDGRGDRRRDDDEDKRTTNDYDQEEVGRRTIRVSTFMTVIWRTIPVLSGSIQSGGRRRGGIIETEKEKEGCAFHLAIARRFFPSIVHEYTTRPIRRLLV